MKRTILTLLALISLGVRAEDSIADEVMRRIYEEVRTPYKYGLVAAPADNSHKYDCPTVFSEGGRWFMTFVCYDGKDGTDGRGYETWLAESADLLHWTVLGRILALPEAYPQNNNLKDGKASPLWDQNQRGGFPALIDWTWGGSYEMGKYKGRRWMTYIGGQGTGYEAVNAPLSIGLASTAGDIANAHQWDTGKSPLMSYADNDAQWWEKLTQYKSTVYDVSGERWEKGGKLDRHRFLMFYNAGGVNPANNLKAERIGIALSNDLRHWKRLDDNPVYAHEAPGVITGDAQIVRMDFSDQATLAECHPPLYVMFYFSAYNPARSYNAYNTFAASRDLLHWKDWDGPDLIWPSKPYDEMFAHKSCVVKHGGVVYHFYCAVNNSGQRGIAVATSVPMGRSGVRFPQPEPAGRRKEQSLDKGWKVEQGAERILVGGGAVNIPHNLDDYYGYRQLRHGNLHGSAAYSRTFTAAKRDGKRYFMQFEGVGTYATVVLNGHAYPRELVGRTVWTLDVTGRLRSGDNELTVLVDHPAMQTESPWVCGGCSSEWGFSEGSQPFGIFRPVTLVETDEVRIEPFGVHVWANADCDTVYVDTEVKNYSDREATVELVNKLAMKSGKQVFRLAETVTLRPGETKTVCQRSPVAGGHRWSPSDPYLHTLTTMLKRGGKTTDDLRTPFGLRSIRWPSSPHSASLPQQEADHRFHINGQPFFINGTCEYEHLLGSSHAFSTEQIAARIKMVRNAGFNALREAHQPHNLRYHQLCEEQGLLFWSQFSAHIWYDTPQFRDNFKRMLTRWVKERRNSPAIILWGLQNESILPRDFATECCDIIRALDPTASVQRLITTCNGGEGADWNVVQNWSGTYGGLPDDYGEELSQAGQLLNGEYGAWRTLDLHGDAKYSEESFTALLTKKSRLARRAFDANDATASPAAGRGVCGHFQWLLASHDNPGRTQPDGALRRIDKVGPVNYKGLLTIWEEPTMAYQAYAADCLRMAGDSVPSATATPIPPAYRRHDLLKAATGHHYLYRINCGGDSYTDEYGQQWQADDSLLSHSWGQDFEGIHPFQASQRCIADSIRGTGSDALFQRFRFGRHRLWYDLPVTSTSRPSPLSRKMYRIELYFLEPWHGKGDSREEADYEGLRIFDVAVNDSTVIDDLDPWAEAGCCGAIKRVVYAPARDGRLHISFPKVKAGQAVIAAIAVAEEQRDATADGGPHPGGETHFWQAFDTDTISRLPKEQLPRDDDPRPATVYEPSRQAADSLQHKSHTTFVITPGLGQEYAMRFRYKNTGGSAVKGRLTITDSKNAVLVSSEMTFPPTPDKFKMISTTTGTQINAGVYRLEIDAEGVEFKNMELQ